MLYAPMIYAPNGFTRTSFKKENQNFLDVGCGSRKLPGAIGIDRNSGSQADITHDLELFPWPLQDNSYDLVLMSHVLEHLKDTDRTMKEVLRILVPGGRVVIQVPYFRSVDAFADPTHCHYFAIQSETFIVVSGFLKKGFWIGWPHPARNPVKEWFKSFVHAFPAFYETYTSYLAPAECLTWELEKTR